MNFVHNVLSSMASYCYRERCEVVFFDPSTSIGMASDMLRLWLLFAGSVGKRIIIVPGYRILGTTRDGQRVFPREIYFLHSPLIAKMPSLPACMLRLFVTACYIFTWVLRRLNARYSDSWTKSLFNAYDVYSPHSFSQEDVQLLNPRFSIELDLSPAQINRIQREVNGCGFQLPDKYVCLHIRTGAYYEEDKDNIRNSSIDNYYRLIMNLIERGFFVVRLGDNIKLPQRFVGLPGFFDYPSSPLKSELFDLWLIRNCTFYLGNLSGLQDTAFLFEKDVVLTNVIPQAFRYSGQKFVSLMKKIFLNPHSMMSRRDILEHVPDFLDHGEDFKFCENTESELVAALDAYFSYDTASDDSFSVYQARVLEFSRFRIGGSVSFENIKKSDGVLIFSS